MIGGEFEIEPSLLLPGPRLINPHTAFASGRGALHAIVRDAMRRYSVDLILLPEYLCRSMIVAVEDAQCDYAYYRLREDLLPDMAHVRNVIETCGRRCAVVLVDYFGLTDPLLDEHRLDDLPLRPVLIVDMAHAAFRFTLAETADYAFTTYRKSLASPDGAPVLMRADVLVPPSDMQAPFVAEKITGNIIKAQAEADRLPDEAYLSHTRHAEHMLDTDAFYNCRMSDESATILGNLDLAKAAERRRENFKLLAGLLMDVGVEPIRQLEDGRVPLFLPVFLRSRDRVRAALAAERIFCPVHWPFPTAVAIEPPRPEMAFWREELSLVIDQRYRDRDIRRIADGFSRALEHIHTE